MNLLNIKNGLFGCDNKEAIKKRRKKNTRNVALNERESGEKLESNIFQSG